MDWGGLAIITFAGAYGLFSWRWSVRYNASFFKMVSGKVPEPGSWRYKSLQVGRWVGVVFSAFVIVLVVSDWILGLPGD
jgi:hypothetical protein